MTKPTQEELDERFNDMPITDLLEAFPTQCQIKITHVLAGEYRVGYEFGKTRYIPGTPSYYPLKEALQRCLWEFIKLEGEEHLSDFGSILMKVIREQPRLMMHYRVVIMNAQPPYLEDETDAAKALPVCLHRLGVTDDEILGKCKAILADEFYIYNSIRSWHYECVPVPARGSEQQSVLYESYKRWCDEHFEDAVSLKVFHRSLANMGHEIKIVSINGVRTILHRRTA